MMSASVAQFNFSAHGDKQIALGLNVADVRDVFQDYGLVGQDSGSHGRQRGILGSTDADTSHQGIATTVRYTHIAVPDPGPALIR